MALGDDLNSEVGKILSERWRTRDGRKVPESTDVQLGNDAVKLEGTVLYADLDDSTRLVDTMPADFAAAIYKSYLVCAARIIRSQGGTITAYDGDRVMSVFFGDYKSDSAAQVALKINFAVTEYINPAIRAKYPNTGYSLKQVVGIDTSELFVARTGIRGANDLVWVGRAANHAAKLSGRDGPPSQITAEVYNKLSKALKYGTNGRHMWNLTISPEIGNRRIYTSNWRWSL